MKILELVIHNFRGIVDMPPLQVNGQNMVVYGRNGVGKSAVADAVDFLLTGDVSRLSGEGTSEVSLKKHGPHVGKNPADSFVQAKLQTAEGIEFTVKRVVSKSDVVEIEEEYRTLFLEIEQYAKNGAHFLSRRELLKYIVVTPTKRAEQIQTLLDIPDVKKQGEYFTKAVKEAKHRRDTAQVEYDGTIKSIRELCDLDTELESVNVWRKILGAPELESIDVNSIMADVSYMGTVTDVSKVTTIQKLNNIVEKIVDLYEKIEMLDSRISEVVSEIVNADISVSEIKKISLINSGIDLLDGSGKCPLCDMQWDDEKTLKAYLLTRKEKSEIVSRLNAEYHKNFDVLLVSINAMIKMLLEGTVPEEYNEECAILLQIQQEVKTKMVLSNSTEYDTYVELSEPLIKYLKAIDYSVLINECKVVVGKIEQTIDTGEKQKADAWNKINRYSALYQQREQNKITLDKIKNLYDKISLVQKKYEASQDNVLNRLYDEIKDRFVYIYRKLHGNDEANFEASLERAKTGVGLSVDFHEQGQFPPVAYHSEGHQDSMGIALYFALMEHLVGAEKGLIVLDDVVMSVDIEHRLNFCDFLRDEYSDYQFLITTHDEVWEKYLEKHGVVNRKNAFNFINWTVESGPVMITKGDVWSECKKKADVDLNSAAHYLRREMEEFFEETCDLLGAKVIYNAEHRWDFGQYFSSSVGKLNELYKLAKNVANQYKNESKIEELKELSNKLSEASTEVEKNNWITNRLIHKNTEVFSRTEFDLAVESLKKICSCFECSICKSKYKVAYEDGHTASAIKCNCGAHMFSLIKR